MLVVLVICLLMLLKSLLKRTVLGEEGSDLHYHLSPGFHQKVEIENLQGYASFRVRVEVQSRILLIPASIVPAFGLAFVLL